MRIAVLSDIHANLHALQAVHKDLLNANVDAVYCLGDLVGYGAFPNEVVEFVRANRFPTVMGSFDEAAGFQLHEPRCRTRSIAHRIQVDENFLWTKSVLKEANRSFLQTLPLQIRFKVSGKRILLVHGSPRGMDEYLTPDFPGATFAQISRLAGSDILCVGSSHQYFHRRSGMTCILNPGSVGLPDGEAAARYAVLDLSWRLQIDFRSVAYDVQLAAQALKDQGLPVPAEIQQVFAAEQVFPAVSRTKQTAG